MVQVPEALKLTTPVGLTEQPAVSPEEATV
jgi:hypothetical protein